MEAGLDSLGATELQAALGTAFSLELPATTSIDYPTSAALAAYISSMTVGLPAHAGMHCQVLMPCLTPFVTGFLCVVGACCPLQDFLAEVTREGLTRTLKIRLGMNLGSLQHILSTIV